MKEMNKKGLWGKIILVLVILILIIAGYLVYVMFFTGASYSGKSIGEFSSENLVVNEELISASLNEIGATSLHKNPFTRSKPVILFSVNESKFYATIDKTIETKAGSVDGADLEIVTTNEEFASILSKPDFNAALKESVENGKTTVNVLSSESNLAAKGYLSVYDNLK